MEDLSEIFDFHEKYKPLVRFGKEIPGYYVSKEGDVYSTKTNKFMGRSISTSKRTGRLEAVFFRAAIRKGFFEDYKHTRGNDRDTWNGAKLNITYHRAVAETWMPIDEYPPESLKDCWKDLPEVAKQWVRDTALVDHINDDPTDNRLENLRWVTPKQNEHNRKKSEKLNGEI